MSLDRNQEFFNNEFSDKEMDTFFEEGQKESNDEVNSVKADTQDYESNEKAKETEEVEPVKELEDTLESEKEADKETEQTDQNKTLNEQDRYKAMAEEERIRRKEIQKQIETLNHENKKLKDTFDRILQKAQEQAELESQPKPPSYEENPLEALRYENEQLKKKVGTIEQTNNQRQQQEQQQHEMQQRQDQFIGTYKAKAEEFTKSTPDFKEAYNYLLSSREQEYKAAGYSPEQVNQLLVEDEAAIVATALGQNANPAQRLYEIAKLRGYKQTSNINNQDKIQANNEKIANLERGLRASKSVNSGGMSAKDHLTLEDVAEMSDDDLDKVDWNKLMRSG